MSDGRTAALASELRRRGLEAPALLLLHAHRPLRPLLGSLAVFLSPMTRPLGSRTLQSLSERLESDEGYDALIGELEEGEATD
jgi:hypothetical protein